ncbi:bifunctional 2-polyprenyl-6-hydroxyphenol methylase/3-demethylubiquinol 3-O-methyltransferase UbiG [Maridesulfovibrio ferrireducens]|uniref:class I SAM-dependent methyltransferase n=1 Tax=Maridesulfovibrio ferrireducens TaxID=246191 RepID=UPI001A26217D|nr:class I SAM-dependent methyltransferase [Maridesulfovibrio ferrireducens]MBI9113154.1 class I SAM-dependent methyltransferase [Maridesulfovibrio ferrireducens]
MITQNEKKLQEGFSWTRSQMFATYNEVLGYYQALSCLEYAKGDSLLDMPCGDGLLTSMMAHRFKKVVGLDASSKHLALAKNNIPNAELHETLIEDFKPNIPFDTITMLNVLEHVENPVSTLRHSASLLSDDGVLIVHVPNALAINRKLAVLMGTLTECEELSPFDIEIAGHRRSYSLKTLQADIQEAGLKVSATGGIFYKMLSTAQIDWFLKNGLWEEGGFGWGRVGGPNKDWKKEFCRACYELGKEHPEDCNVIYACITK